MSHNFTQKVNLPIEYSDKPVTPYGGMALMKRFVDRVGIREYLAELDSPQPGSNRGYASGEVLESFWLNIWTGASPNAKSTLTWDAENRLISTTVGTTTTYDGNGNISEYLDETGAIAAHYEYAPFGTTTLATGPKAADFAHRFSTKPLDTETGLYYYGYRYYDPETGRWPSKDPIDEQGGVNLYGFVGNDGVNKYDVLGEAAALPVVVVLALGGAIYCEFKIETIRASCSKKSAAAKAKCDLDCENYIPDPKSFGCGHASFTGDCGGHCQKR